MTQPDDNLWCLAGLSQVNYLGFWPFCLILCLFLPGPRGDKHEGHALAQAVL